MAATTERGPATQSPSKASTLTKRNVPQLPTPTELLVLLAYPVLLLFGALFSALSPETRAAPYDAVKQSHVQSTAPSYFARKDNIFNVFFVKRGWGWITVAFVLFILTHPALAVGSRRLKAGVRWALVTTWWVLVTQWCFGPAIIDRGFRFTGGKCEVAKEAVADGTANRGEAFTAVACKTMGGQWKGGHDISGHVFLLVLGSFFLLQEVGWVALRAGALAGRRDERTVVMPDGAVKGAGVESEKTDGDEKPDGLGLGGKFAAVITLLSWWMLLMTAIYFHTWFEKCTGLLTAIIGIYPIYFLPRLIPAMRAFIGLPGI